MPNTYTVNYIRKMSDVVYQNTISIDNITERLKNCSRKLKALNKGITLIADRLECREE